MTAVDFSVVVPTYNRPLDLRRMLESVAAQRYPRDRFEVVVVDDGSDPPLARLEDEYQGRLLLSVIRQANAGCGPARQTGIDHSRGRYLVFTDDDCCPASDWLVQLASVFARYPGCGVGGRTVNGLAGQLFSETSQFIVGLLTTHERDTSGEIRFCPTSNSAFPTNAFRSMGGFDRSWRNSGGEDRDFCRRWRSAGYALRYEPTAVVRHFHPMTAPQFLRQHMGYGRGALRFHSRKPNGFAPPAFYRDLLLGPFREYPALDGIRIAGAVALSQVATAAGFALEALRAAKDRR